MKLFYFPANFSGVYIVYSVYIAFFPGIAGAGVDKM